MGVLVTSVLQQQEMILPAVKKNTRLPAPGQQTCRVATGGGNKAKPGRQEFSWVNILTEVLDEQVYAV